MLSHPRKGTLIQEFMAEYKGHDRFGFSVSHTTRQPRQGEEDGIHYHFVSKSEFADGSKFVEWAKVHGNFYGTSWESLRAVQSLGKKVLLDIDVQGVRRLKAIALEEKSTFQPRFIFIAPPSLETLQERLVARGTESSESMQRRLANARAEVEYGQTQGNFDAIIINDNVQRATRELADTIEQLYDEF
jgi:guanylate kinase